MNYSLEPKMASYLSINFCEANRMQKSGVERKASASLPQLLWAISEPRTRANIALSSMWPMLKERCIYLWSGLRLVQSSVLKHLIDFIELDQAQKNRVRSAGGSIHSQGRNESKLQLQAMISVVSDDEQQQQIMPIAFSQQLICNPKILLFQGCTND